MKKENYPYDGEWKRHRLLTRMMTTGVVSGCLFLFLSCIDFSALLNNVLLLAAFIMIAAYLGAFAFLMFWKCPCCGQSFYGWTRDTTPGFSESCKNCGLRQYEGAGFQ